MQQASNHHSVHSPLMPQHTQQDWDYKLYFTNLLSCRTARLTSELELHIANQLSSPACSARVMKDSAGWQVQLRKHKAQPPACWPELHHQGEHFVVGKPQAAFEVVVTPPVGALQPGQNATVSRRVTGAACCAACAKHDSNISSAGSRTGLVPAEMPYMPQVALKVDGRCPGYVKYLSSGSKEATFNCFLRSVDCKNMEEGFAFGAPEMVEPTEPSPKRSSSKLHTDTDKAASTAAGQISVEVDLSRWAAHSTIFTGLAISSCACDKLLYQWQYRPTLSHRPQYAGWIRPGRVLQYRRQY